MRLSKQVPVRYPPGFPAARYRVIAGELVCRVIKHPREEQPGWEPSPHRFRPVSAAEFLRLGRTEEAAAALYQRELKRVRLVFAGHSLEEAEVLADQPEPDLAPAHDRAALEARIAQLEGELAGSHEALASARTEMEERTTEFNERVKTLVNRKPNRFRRRTQPEPTSTTGE